MECPNQEPVLLDRTGASLAPCTPAHLKPAADWPPVIVTRETIEREVERLADLPRPDNGRRQTLIMHPNAPQPGRGLTPGVQVTLDVLKPGEETAPLRHNSTQVNFCIRGSGRTFVGDRAVPFVQYDVWNHPSYATYRHTNDGRDLQVRLTYSNAALLEMMRVHVVDEHPPTSAAERKEPSAARDSAHGKDPSAARDSAHEEHAADPRRRNPFGTFAIGREGAELMPYEILINPPAVASPALHWPWATVRSHLEKLEALGTEYVGRRLYLLYNPLTTRFNGTTPNFFATMTIRPPGIVDKPHRHISSAINYYFSGAGYSRVEGKRYEWKAGDLMVSAPGWAVHNHASYDERVFELTIQDQPLNIFMESLMWQEDLALPPRILGTDAGFATNRSA
jgi:gentisate 1,2-dioxygenase